MAIRLQVVTGGAAPQETEPDFRELYPDITNALCAQGVLVSSDVLEVVIGACLTEVAELDGLSACRARRDGALDELRRLMMHIRTMLAASGVGAEVAAVLQALLTDLGVRANELAGGGADEH